MGQSLVERNATVRPDVRAEQLEKLLGEIFDDRPVIERYSTPAMFNGLLEWVPNGSPRLIPMKLTQYGLGGSGCLPRSIKELASLFGCSEVIVKQTTKNDGLGSFGSNLRAAHRLIADAPALAAGGNEFRRLGLSVRVWHALASHGIRTIEELCGWTACELLDIRNFGAGALEEVERMLATAGWSLSAE